MTMTKSNLSPVIHTSKPGRDGRGGGVEYVEFSGPEATRVLMTHGLAHMLGMFGLDHIKPWDVFLSNNGYGDARTFVVRIKRDVAEGRAEAAKPVKEQAAKPVWQAPAAVNTPLRQGRRRA